MSQDNSELAAQIEQVELSIEEATKVVEFGEALQRLERNPDFKKVIFEGYFTTEAARLVMLTGDTTLKPEQQDNTLHSIRGIAELRNFLFARKALAEQMAKDIVFHKEGLEEMRGEDAGEGTEDGEDE